MNVICYSLKTNSASYFKHFPSGTSHCLFEGTVTKDDECIITAAIVSFLF